MLQGEVGQLCDRKVCGEWTTAVADGTDRTEKQGNGLKAVLRELKQSDEAVRMSCEGTKT